MKICFLLLAAGASSRMGQPKMLLPYRGKSFLTHMVDEALAALGEPVFVVTGAEHASIEAALTTPPLSVPVQLLHNRSWGEGMSSSIRRGIQGISANGRQPDAAIIGVCDQPFVSAGLLQELVAVWKSSGKGIVGCTYDGTTGTPVLFDRKYFNELSLLQGVHGAKKLLKLHAEDVVTVEFPEGGVDVDTPADYRRISDL